MRLRHGRWHEQGGSGVGGVSGSGINRMGCDGAEVAGDGGLDARMASALTQHGDIAM